MIIASIMASKQELLDWNDLGSIKANMPPAKGSVTRACSAIGKIIKRPYIYSTANECAEAHKRLHQAFEHCVDLHNKWEVLELSAGTVSASKETAESLAPYETKYHNALDALDSYIKTATAAMAPTAAPEAPTTATSKLSACKILFQEALSQSKSPEEFRLWVSAFRRFYEASSLSGTNVATQQGYLLRALDFNLRKTVERKITATMAIFGPGGCMDVLEAEFKMFYPIFSRRLEFFQATQDPGEDPTALLQRMESMGDMADLATMTQDELTAFRFMTACTDKRLRDKLFELKRKDMATIKGVVHQHSQQLKLKSSIAGTIAKQPIAAVTPAEQAKKQTKRHNPIQRPAELKGRCNACGATSHKAPECKIRKNKTLCTHCGKSGHLAKVCYSALNQKSDKASNDDSKKINAMRHTRDSDSSDYDTVWQRLHLKITHPHGHFNFATFPDTGAAATVLASNLADRKGIKATEKRPQTDFINVCGNPVPVIGIANITLHIGNHTADTKAIISPALHDDVIIGRRDLQRLGIISSQFPKPINIISQASYEQFNKVRAQLINNHPEVLTDNLPDNAMEGCVMQIHLTPGEKKPFRITTARQVPLHWKEKAEKIVDKLLREKVITRQAEPTEWCAPGFFVIKKNGDLRLVIYYTQLNRHVRRPIHTFPSTQEILAGLDPESCVFAKLDATQGYHQIPLEEESSKLTTFPLPSGRFRYLRAPMGLSCSSDEFCRRSDEVVEGLPGVRKLVDDILIQAPDLNTLNHRIEQLIARCKKHNFTLSRRKLEIGHSVEFAGQIVSQQGVKPNPKYLQGIHDFPAPELRIVSDDHQGFRSGKGTAQSPLRSPSTPSSSSMEQPLKVRGRLTAGGRLKDILASGNKEGNARCIARRPLWI